MLNRKNLLPFLLPALYFGLVFLFFPFRGVFFFDPDEGINLGKAQLMLQGYSLYDQIWSDQPPVLAHLLSLVLGVFGLKVNIGRLFILLLTCGLIWAFVRFLQSVWGDFHAAAGVFILLLLPMFVVLSVSVMVGLPAIAFAVIALNFLAQWHTRRKPVDLLFSAVFLALSLMTKLFTGVLVPVFLAGILIDEFTRRQAGSSWKKTLTPFLTWSFCFGLVLILLGLLLVKPQNLYQLIEVHLRSRSVPQFIGDPSLTLAYHLKSAVPVLLLALTGLVYTVLSRRWLSLYPAAWMLTAGLMLANHHPVWYHQQLLVTVPAAYLAAITCGEVARDLQGLWVQRFRLDLRRLFSLVCLALLVFMLFTRVPAALAGFNTRPSLHSPGFNENSTQAQILNKMGRYASQTNWVITDEPIVTVWAKLPVPPELLVFTNKRLSTGELSDEQVLAFFQEYRPEQVLFTQYSSPLIDRYLDENYQLIYTRGAIRLYIRDDIASDGSP